MHLKTLKIVSFKENSTFFIITIYLTLLDYEFHQKKSCNQRNKF